MQLYCRRRILFVSEALAKGVEPALATTSRFDSGSRAAKQFPALQNSPPVPTELAGAGGGNRRHREEKKTRSFFSRSWWIRSPWRVTYYYPYGARRP